MNTSVFAWRFTFNFNVSSESPIILCKAKVVLIKRLNRNMFLQCQFSFKDEMYNILKLKILDVTTFVLHIQKVNSTNGLSRINEELS